MKFIRSPFEYLLLFLFVLFLVFPFPIPPLIGNLVNSPLGMIALFLFIIALFIYLHPVIGVLSIFVAYELIRRSTPSVTGKTEYVQYTPENRDEEIKKLNPPEEKTLEESIVSKMSPIGQSNVSDYVNTSFKPIADNNHNASLF